MFCENVEVSATQQLKLELSLVSLRVYDSESDDWRGSASAPCNTSDRCSSVDSPTSSSTRPMSVKMRVSALLVRPAVVIFAAGTNTPRPPSIVKYGSATMLRS